MEVNKHPKQIILRLSLALAALLFLFTNSLQALALSDAQTRAFQSGVLYFDVNGDAICTPDSAGNVGGSVAAAPVGNIYMVGDSLMVGMRDDGQISTKLQNKGFQVTQIEAKVGDSVDAALPKVQSKDDQANIAKSPTVLVELGTNPAGNTTASADSFKPEIDKMITAIKKANQTAKIYWVNTFDDDKSTDYSGVNSALSNESSSQGYQVIDWHSEASNNKAKYAPFNGVPGPPHVHPSHYDAMADFIVNSLTGGSSGGGGNSSSGSVDPSKLSAADKVAQLLMVDANASTAQALEKKYSVGGFYASGANANIYNASEIANIKKAGSVPALIGIDQEGGKVNRLKDAGQYGDMPSAKQMGSMDDNKVQTIAGDVGKKMNSLGIDVDFAPVADLDSGKNKAISGLGRAFSNDPKVVAQKAGAFAQGLTSSSITPTFKHFPGLGNAVPAAGANQDGYPATTWSFDQMKKNDLVPYETLLKNNSGDVMVGNQTVPGLTNGDPASMSPATYDLLKNTYGYSGLVFTDSLQGQPGNLSDNVTKALNAGADMVLVGSLDDKSLGDLIAKLQKTLNPSTINSALAAVLRAKNGSGQAQAQTASGCCPTGSTTSLSGNSNEDKIWNYLIGKGLTPLQAAAIMGNWEQESGFDPTAYYPHTHTDNPDPSTAFGIAQWLGDRQVALRKLADSRNLPITDLGVQLDFAWQELTTYKKDALDHLKQLQSEDQLNQYVDDFEIAYEGAGSNANFSAREANAHKIYHQYTDGGGSVSGTAASQTTSCSTSGDLSGYLNPLRDIKNLYRDRIDMGVDYGGSGPVYAIGNGKVTALGNPSNYWLCSTGNCEPAISYELSDGAASGLTVYFAENCVPSKNLKVGDPVTNTTVICQMSGGVETGWAETSSYVPMADPDYYPPSCPKCVKDGTATAYGVNFSDFMGAIGGPTGEGEKSTDWPKVVGTLKPGWPSWK